MDEYRYLTRFRADPKKVRIQLRWNGEEWQVKISALPDPLQYKQVWAYNKSALKALVRAYQMAEQQNLPGLDRYMQWAYDHPQEALGPNVSKCKI